MFRRLIGTRKPPCLAALLAITSLGFPGVLSAQDFEGVLTQRTISMRHESFEMFVEPVYEELYEDEELDQEEEMGRLAEKIFAIPFEQLLTAARSSDAEVLDVTMYVKGAKIRSDVEEEGSPFSYVIADLESGTLLMVSTPGKYFVKWSAEEMEKTMAEIGIDPEAAEHGAMEPAERPEVRDLGKSVEVNDMSCRAYEIAHDGNVSIGWLTTEHASLRRTFKSYSEKIGSMFDSGQDQSDIDVENLFWEKGVPVRIQSLEGNDYSGFTAYEIQDLISVESKSVSDDLFEVPAGYAEKTIKELWGQG